MSDPARLLELARRRGAILATAESCTGGMIAAAITDPPGASAAFDRGFVTYSNAAKMAMLGVAAATLERHGAVSEPVARQMAEGALARSAATHAVAVTGIAGPGGSGAKPEGRVCFALCDPAGTRVQTVDYGAQGRARVRTLTRDHALALLIAALA